MAYFLKVNDTTKTLADWKITKAVLTLKSLDCDELCIHSQAEFAYNATVQLFSDNLCVFSGKVRTLPQYEAAQTKYREYKILGPWNDLCEIVYQQKWKCAKQSSNDGTQAEIFDTYKSRVILGENDAEERIDIGAQIENIVEFAKAAGANIQSGNIAASYPMLCDETCDINCAQAVKRTLKWLPDAISFFDYSTTPPKLNVVRRNALDKKQINLNSDSVKDYKVSPRNDLLISGVEIKYEKTQSIGSESYSTLQCDKYPPNFDSRTPKSLVMTVELDGYKGILQEHTIQTEEIKPNDTDWWVSKIPSLSEAYNLKILESSRDFPDYKYALTKGTIPDWANIESKVDTICAYVSYTTTSHICARQKISIRLRVTKTKSRKFSRLATSRSDEPVPEGLAQSLYAGLGTLQYDSQFCIYNAQAHNYAGKALNLKGANPLFENMNSAVVECRQDLFESTLTIKAGSPEHLYPAKIAELFRINKARKTTASFSTKTKAQSPLKGKISLNAQSVKEVPTQINTVMRSITLSVDATKPKIVLDSSNIPDGITLGVQRVLVCENGQPAYAYTILSNTE